MSELYHMSDKARFLVWDYIRRHLDKSDPEPSFAIYEVWHCYILENEKWLLSSTLNDGMYYEVTYDNDKQRFYLDAYKKFQNYSIPFETASKMYTNMEEIYNAYCH